MFVITDEEPRPNAAKVFAKISVRDNSRCLGGNRTSGGRHEDQMGQRLGPALRVLEGQEAAVRVTEQRKLPQSEVLGKIVDVGGPHVVRVVTLGAALRLTVSPLIRNGQANAELRQIQNAWNMKGASIHAHAPVKTNQGNALADIRVRQAYAIDCSRHFSAQSNA